MRSRRLALAAATVPEPRMPPCSELLTCLAAVGRLRTHDSCHRPSRARWSSGTQPFLVELRLAACGSHQEMAAEMDLLPMCPDYQHRRARCRCSAADQAHCASWRSHQTPPSCLAQSSFDMVPRAPFGWVAIGHPKRRSRRHLLCPAVQIDWRIEKAGALRDDHHY